MIAISLLLAVPQTIDLPPAYYRLSELEERLSAVAKVKVAPEARRDVYVFSLKNVTWDQARAAIVADGRLAWREIEGEWHLHREPKMEAEEARARTRYLDAVRQTIHGVYGRAAKETAAILALPSESRDSNLERIPLDQRLDALTQASNQLIIEAAGTQNISFAQIGFPSWMTEPGRSATFATLVRTNLVETIRAVDPSGRLTSLKSPAFDLEKMELARQEAFAKNTVVAVKLPFDPLTLTTSCRILMAFAEPAGAVASYENFGLTPEKFALMINPEQVFDPSTLARLGERGTQTDTLSGKSTEIAVMPSRPVRVSEALLRIAREHKSNLVCYVSPLTDWPLAKGASRSTFSILRDANSERLDPGFLARNVRERTGLEPGAKPSLGFQLGRKITMAPIPGGAVFRNEFRFLDGLVMHPDLLGPEFSNQLFSDKLAPLDQVARAIEAQTWAPLQSSLFANATMEFCNPMTFRPFAKVWIGSPTFRAGVGRLDVGEKYEIPFTKLEGPVRANLVGAMEDASSLNDAILGLTHDPIFTATGYRKTSDSWILEATKREGGLDCRITSKSNPIWVTTVSNVTW